MTAEHHGDRPEDRVTEEGLQDERTYLAWQRTGLAFAAVGALFVHGAGRTAQPLATAAGSLSTVFGAVLLTWATVGCRRRVDTAHDRRVAVPGIVAAVSVATGVLCLSGLVLVVLDVFFDQ